jgi:hypothetical protein
MQTLSIADLGVRQQTGVSELSATVRRGDHSQNLYFRTTHSPVATSADPFVPAVLLPAMRAGFDIHIDTPVSTAILASAERVQEVEAAWNIPWHLIKIDADNSAHTGEHTGSNGAVAAFFSGGVDSFYTLQKHLDEITHLVFVSGFDIPLGRSDARELAMRQLRKVSEAVGLPLIEVETNLRDFSDGLNFSWEPQHGAALAAVAHFLAPGFDKIYFPSSFALPFLLPFGSHPGLDPLWGSSSLEINHDGIEATRFDKIGALSDWDLALQNLRVCWQVVEGQYNCCRCRKCLWTMAFLRSFGVLECATCFPCELDLQALGRQHADQYEQRYRLFQAISHIESMGGDPELVDALHKVLQQKPPQRRPRWRRALGRLKASIRKRK